ncbi:MAG: thermonuclease family protein, partial [Halothece sp.]
DGDTLVAIDNQGNEIKVRFACIDAPEIPHTTAEKQSRKLVDKSQFSWGESAKERVEELIAQGNNNVVLNITDTDRYGRKISEVRLADGTFIQEVLLKEGLAQVYTQHLANCPSSAIVTQAEAMAKGDQQGIWGDEKFVPAWDFRQNSK